MDDHQFEDFFIKHKDSIPVAKSNMKSLYRSDGRPILVETNNKPPIETKNITH